MKISTIIPAYNCEKYIWQTLDCLALQSFKDIEIIVLLDHCTDNTEWQIRQYAKVNKHIQIKVICFDKNMGPSHARNIGVRFAMGDYIHFMDADDANNVDFYKNLYESAVETDSDVACACFVNEREPQKNVIYDHKVVICNRQDKIDATHVDYQGFSGRYLFNRKFWNINHFRFPEDMYHCEDLVLMLSAIVESNHIVLVPDAVYIYKNRERSLTTDPERDKRRQRKTNYKKCLHILKDFMRKNGLRRSMFNIREKKYKLFGMLTIIKTKFLPYSCEKRIYFLDILVFKTKYIIQNYRERVEDISK